MERVAACGAGAGAREGAARVLVEDATRPRARQAATQGACSGAREGQMVGGEEEEEGGTCAYGAGARRRQDVDTHPPLPSWHALVDEREGTCTREDDV